MTERPRLGKGAHLTLDAGLASVLHNVTRALVQTLKLRLAVAAVVTTIAVQVTTIIARHIDHARHPCGHPIASISTNDREM